LVVSIIIAIASNLTYSFAKFYWTILLARFVAGISEGNYTVAMTYLSYATDEKNRVLVYTINGVITVLGFILGPALASLGTLPIFPITFNFPTINYSIIISETTVPGYIGCITNGLCLIFVIVFFKDIKKPSDKPDYEDLPTPIIGVSTILYLMFAQTLSYTIMETIGTPYTVAAYNWTIRDNSFMWTAIGLVAIIVGLLVIPLEKIANERVILIISEIIMLAGSSIIINPLKKFVSIYIFLSAQMLASIGYGLSQSVVNSVYSKILEGQDQGIFMGYLTAASSLARTTAPIGTAYLFQYTQGRYIYIIDSIVTLIALLMCVIAYKKLAPRELQDLEVTGETLLLTQ